MRTRCLLLGMIFASCASLVAEAVSPATSDGPLSFDQYREKIASLHKELSKAERISKADARELSGSLPLSLTVRDGGQEYEVSLYFIHDALAKAAAADTQWNSARQKAIAVLSALEEETGNATTPLDYDAAHAHANAILSTREFRAVHGPTKWDEFKAKIYDYFIGLLDRTFRRIAPWINVKYVIYGIATVILLAFGWWIWRMLPKNAEEALLNLASPVPVSARHWSEWLRQARAAAESNSWRDAVHLAYWAGISFLEAGGLWRPDRARTPREYLKLVPTSAPQRPALKEMTHEFERAWYAQQPSGSAEFARMLTHLEVLGCQ